MSKIKTVEVAERKEIQKKRMDDAIAKVEADLMEARGIFAKRLHARLGAEPYGFRVNLAKAMKCAPSTVTVWESYGSTAFEKLARMCKFLDVDANYLLGLTDTCRTLSEVTPEEIECPHCGTHEFLCGHNGVGCTSAKANQ